MSLLILMNQRIHVFSVQSYVMLILAQNETVTSNTAWSSVKTYNYPNSVWFSAESASPRPDHRPDMRTESSTDEVTEAPMNLLTGRKNYQSLV